MGTSIKLGDESLVRLLYSYPNNANEVGFLSQTLEQTVFNTSEPDAKKLCAALPHPLLLTIGKQSAPLGALDAEIDALRERLGALDAREPDKIPLA